MSHRRIAAARLERIAAPLALAVALLSAASLLAGLPAIERAHGVEVTP